MKHAFLHSFLSVALVAGGATALAETPEEKGLAIAKQQKAKNEGWGDSTSEMKMTLRTPSGKENVRNIKLKSLEVGDDGDKSLMVFEEPKDVAGTAFLSFSHIAEPDDQWIYLPALKRVKRISSKKKSGSFMGSEFSFEDLASFEVEKYDFKYLRDEPCGKDNKLTCFVLESTPRDKYSGYTKLISWVDQDEYRTQKTEFYDRKKSLLKVMTVNSYELIDGKFWRPSESLMENKQTGKSTQLQWNDILMGTGLTEGDFSKNNLKRAK
ncbi:Uncharacterised protein [BD1-7 clade bacterium]|uniref:Uncharacterized protein TP-0789 domain-containing protein n=1 Tax=BD1-7 clade bacterium TaxID=2029982 RepID=A0A5S9PLP4_9GAMM|nr:Uncharacterised protein [BD1-7 clade bacterium]CAA0105395.1 Uncharacterised protein [BD1-7 clade bacterium]